MAKTSLSVLIAFAVVCSLQLITKEAEATFFCDDDNDCCDQFSCGLPCDCGCDYRCGEKYHLPKLTQRFDYSCGSPCSSCKSSCKKSWKSKCPNSSKCRYSSCCLSAPSYFSPCAFESPPQYFNLPQYSCSYHTPSPCSYFHQPTFFSPPCGSASCAPSLRTGSLCSTFTKSGGSDYCSPSCGPVPCGFSSYAPSCGPAYCCPSCEPACDVEISDNMKDIENLIPRKSQVLKKFDKNFLQKSLKLANGALGYKNNFKGLFGEKVNSAKFNVGISKNSDVANIMNGKFNVVKKVVNGTTRKAANVSGEFSNIEKNAIDRSVNNMTDKVEGITGGLLDMARIVANAMSDAIHDTVNRVSEKVKNIKEGPLQKDGAVASDKTNAIHGTVNSVSGIVKNVMEGSLNKARDITNNKRNPIFGTVNSITGEVDNINRVLLEKAGIMIDAKTGTILEIVDKPIDIDDTKGGLLETSGSIAGAKSGALSSFVSESENKGEGLEGSGSIRFTQPGTIIEASSPLNVIGEKFVNTTASTAKSSVNTVSGIKSGALNLTDKIIHPGKFYGISAMKRKVVNDILDDAQDEFQSKIGNVVETLSGKGEGLNNHVNDLSINDNGNKNILEIINGLYDTQFYLNDSPKKQAHIIFSDENQPVNFFAESLDTQQRVIEECIPTGQVYIVYHKPDCVNVEQDERGSQEFITAKNDMKSQLNVVVDDIFEKYGNQIIRKAVCVTNGRL